MPSFIHSFIIPNLLRYQLVCNWWFARKDLAWDASGFLLFIIIAITIIMMMMITVLVMLMLLFYSIPLTLTRSLSGARHGASPFEIRGRDNNDDNKRPLTQKSMPPAGDEHARLKT